MEVLVFSSVEFLFRFLPIFLILYFATKPKYRNVTLLIGSLFFYAFGEPMYIFLMILSIYMNHWLSSQIYKNHLREKKTGQSYASGRKKWLVIAMIYNFGMLFVFKYLNFFTGIVNSIVGKDFIPETHLTLPLGISFYTFQMASYVIDVYRGQYTVNRNIISFATYVSMFPQLIAGPIVNYHEVQEQLKERKVDYRNIEWGVVIFIMGMSYKVLLANRISTLWSDVLRGGVLGINAPIAWLGSWGYSMQIFFDFFGYSLMAIGLGKIMGFHFPINFDNPYCSKSATEFWRRWHITLGRWFREYIYIPLGGKRKGKGRLIFNTFVVWALTGLWHGANWNFIIWGLFFFVILMFEKFVILRFLDKSKIIGHLYMFIMIPFSWTIFNITDLATLKMYLCKLLCIPVKGSVTIHAMEKFWEYAGHYWWLLLICVFCCTPIPMKLIKRFYQTWVCRIILLALFWLCVYQLVVSTNNPFLYFRF